MEGDSDPIATRQNSAYPSRPSWNAILFRPSQVVESKCLSPLQSGITHQSTLITCSSTTRGLGTLFQRVTHRQYKAWCRRITNGGRPGEQHAFWETQQESRDLHLQISSCLPQPWPLARCGRRGKHLANLEGFFSHRCCHQASAANGLIVFLGFYSPPWWKFYNFYTFVVQRTREHVSQFM